MQARHTSELALRDVHPWADELIQRHPSGSIRVTVPVESVGHAATRQYPGVDPRTACRSHRHRPLRSPAPDRRVHARGSTARAGPRVPVAQRVRGPSPRWQSARHNRDANRPANTDVKGVGQIVLAWLATRRASDGHAADRNHARKGKSQILRKVGRPCHRSRLSGTYCTST